MDNKKFLATFEKMLEGLEENFEQKINSLRNDIDHTLVKIQSDVINIQDQINNTNDNKSSLDPIDKVIEMLPHRQKDLYLYLRDNPDGLSAMNLSKERGISYLSSYRGLEELKKKGIIKEKWERGHRKKYIITE